MKIWQKIKAPFTGTHKYLVWSSTILVLWFVWAWFWGEGNTIPMWMDTQERNERLDKEIDRYAREIRDMDGIIEEHKTNRDTLEKLARESHLYAAPNEDVYIVE